MGRPSLTTRTRASLERLTGKLDSPGRRAGALGGALVVTTGLHGLLGATQVSWLAAPVVLAAGMVGGAQTGLWVAAAAAVTHGAVDLVGGVNVPDALGVVARTVVLPFLGLAGAAGAQLEQQRDKALHQAVSEDPVTGLLNVRVFYDEVNRLRTGGTPFAILLADIRGMRRLNDTYGHPTGTEAMRALAHVLRRAAGADVLASRLGSDEIAVLLVGDDRDRSRMIVGRAIDRLRHETVRLPDGEAFEIHAAYGIARWPEDGDDAIALLRAADRAKERAKAHGLDEIGHARGRTGEVLVTTAEEEGPSDVTPAGPYDDVRP